MRPTAYRRNARGPRDRQAFEGVRLQAGALFAAGHTQAEVAHQLGVARQNVSRWHARWQAGGLQALASRGPTGPAPRLSDAQLHDLGVLPGQVGAGRVVECGVDLRRTSGSGVELPSTHADPGGARA